MSAEELQPPTDDKPEHRDQDDQSAGGTPSETAGPRPGEDIMDWLKRCDAENLAASEAAGEKWVTRNVIPGPPSAHEPEGFGSPEGFGLELPLLVLALDPDAAEAVHFNDKRPWYALHHRAGYKPHYEDKYWVVTVFEPRIDLIGSIWKLCRRFESSCSVPGSTRLETLVEYRDTLTELLGPFAEVRYQWPKFCTGVYPIALEEFVLESLTAERIPKWWSEFANTYIEGDGNDVAGVISTAELYILGHAGK